MALQMQLEQSQWLPPETLQRLQLEQLTRLLRHAVAQVPHYRSLASLVPAEGSISMEQFRQWPILDRGELQRSGSQVLAEQLSEAHAPLNKIQTSGSTGTPVTAYGSRISRKMFRAITLRDHLWHQRDLSASFAAIRPEVDKPPGETLHNPGWGAATNGAFVTGPAFGLNVRTDLDRQIEWLAEIRPQILLTLPTNIVALGRQYQDRGIQPPDFSEIRTYGEVASDEARRTCREIFNAPMTDMYSTQEVGYIALECHEQRRYHVQSEVTLVEVLDDNNQPCPIGQRGQLVVTPLHNFAFPLIRYRLGDYVELGEPCPCGRGLPAIQKIYGRERNMLILPDGRSHYPSFPAELWTGIAPVKQFQLIQHDLQRIEVKLVAERDLSENELQRLREMLIKRFMHPFRIDFSFHDTIGRSAGGKFEDFISNVKLG